jgi:quercetin dioxygenase-like cupin family protein
MLISGKVKVEVDGYAPTEFTAPTFIVIKKDIEHKFTALEDNSAWFCVFALRDVDGNVTDIYSGDNSPYGGVPAGDMTILENTSIE